MNLMFKKLVSKLNVSDNFIFLDFVTCCCLAKDSPAAFLASNRAEAVQSLMPFWFPLSSQLLAHLSAADQSAARRTDDIIRERGRSVVIKVRFVTEANKPCHSVASLFVLALQSVVSRLTLACFVFSMLSLSPWHHDTRQLFFS